MKKFRKTKDGLFICEECGKILSKNKHSLSHHLRIYHKNINKKLYYDKWLKEEKEGLCKICSKETKFMSYNYGYRKWCCKKCYNLDTYGVEYFYQSTKFKKIRNKTCKEKYGVEEPLQSSIIQEKKKQTCLKNNGVEYLLSSIKFKEDSMINKYGVRNSMHKTEFFDKMQKTSKLKQKYKNTDIWYQGSYELDFLEKYFDKYPDIERGPTITYKLNRDEKIYYSDFFIPSLNLIIEIKSKYWYNINKKVVEIKKKACIKNNYKYILILDKKYNDLENE